ncbi:hypothetical protein K432DRAFT_397038 [Lepidopterella palustris CBS 459.81]|uniref:Mid2 domain-containing protein n=1 Tax=Lepidopterella palustris CBS 459.81 TaxID=1314670 RepID=A0A8E2E1R4_9PEZI|nr:hypothetical protein K432DRAFT_397038 [Lepidopterella palustris CBS 459.81]
MADSAAGTPAVVVVADAVMQDITVHMPILVTTEYTSYETYTQSITATQSVVVQTEMVTKINSVGQTIAQTAVVTSVAATAAAASSTIAAASISSSSSHTGAIVGGVVGGVAFLALLAAFLFIGTRKGWFDKQPAPYPGYPQPGMAAAATGEPKPRDYPEIVSSSTNRSPILPTINTVSSIPTYQTHHMPQQYAGEMEGNGWSNATEMPGNNQPDP